MLLFIVLYLPVFVNSALSGCLRPDRKYEGCRSCVSPHILSD